MNCPVCHTQLVLTHDGDHMSLVEQVDRRQRAADIEYDALLREAERGEQSEP